MTRTTTFTRGSGAYRCRCCNRLTRDDGNGDSVNCRLCTQCFELSGYDNMITDGGSLDETDISTIKYYLAVLQSKHDYKVGTWTLASFGIKE